MLVDLDPQGNASTGLGIPGIARTSTTYELLVEGASVDECTVPTAIPNLDVLPSTVDLSGAELELVAEEDRATRLRDALAGHRGHQVCFIDCPPSLGLLTLNALTAADTLLVGVVLTMFDRRNRLTDQVAEDVRECLGNLVFESVIPRNVRLSEAPSHGLPALVYDHGCAGSRAYMDLARELVARLPKERIAA